MELVAIARVLRRRSGAVWVGLAFALLAGLVALYRVSLLPPALESRQEASGEAVMRVLVDTPNSLRVDARARGSDTVVSRAILLGGDLAAARSRTRLARRMDVPVDSVGVLGPALEAPASTSALADEATAAARPKEPFVLSVEALPGLSVLALRAEAPTPGLAAALAEGGAAELVSLAERQSMRGGAPTTVDRVGPPAIEIVHSGLDRIAGVAVAFVVLALWCFAVVLADSLAWRLRRRHGMRLAGRHV